MHANRWHQATAWIVRVLLIALLAVVAASVAVLVLLPRATHGTALTVHTGSMTPTLPVASVDLDRPVDPGPLRVRGDPGPEHRPRSTRSAQHHEGWFYCDRRNCGNVVDLPG